MGLEVVLPLGAALAALLAAVLALAVLARQAQAMQRLRLVEERVLAGQRGEAETLRAIMAATERALGASQADTAAALRREVGGAIRDMRGEIHQQLAATREATERQLGAIQASVNEHLHAAVEKQMTASFARVTAQFAQVQQAMGEMQAVGAQIGDLKRLFSNVKTRGGWGETQVRAMLDDILPAGAYETNWRPRADSRDAVEFALIMPGREGARPRLAIDAKFPTEDYERLLSAQDAADPEADRAARAALARRIREEARKLAEKYIAPPATVEFAVMYLPTDGLYAEVARIPGLLDEIGRSHHVVVLGPSLFPALLRTIHLGHVTLSLEQKADEVRRLLGATRGEMQKIDLLLDKLAGQASTMARNLSQARRRTRAVERTLVGVVAIEGAEAERLIGPVDEAAGEADDSSG